MADNEIGSFTFLSIEGRLAHPQENIDVYMRPNVDGEAIRLAGVWAEPSRLVCAVDVATHTAAVDLLETYAALVGGAAQNFKRANVAYNTALTQDLKVHVLRVEPIEIAPIRCSVGGLTLAGGASGFLLTTEWIVMATRTP